MKQRRAYAITAEDRATRLNEAGNAVSGYSYICVAPRDGELGKTHKVPFQKDPDKCDHGIEMCASWHCVESWSMDYQVLLWRTVAGRALAERLNVDPLKVAQIQHGDLRVLDIEDFRPNTEPITSDQSS